ncbi:hypothetical protein ACJJTC_001183 [Scirpophaga incertulas]
MYSLNLLWTAHNENAWERRQKRFQRQHNLPGVIGCIDCTHIAIVKPHEEEHTFFNRKGYHSLNVQMIKHSIFFPVQAGPSRRSLLADITNSGNVININSPEPSPSTSAASSARISKENPTKMALAKCTKYMKKICNLKN